MLKVTADSYAHAQDCPFRNVLDKMGDKWSFLLFAVLEDEPKRFNVIKREIGDISQRVLTRKLRDLERDGYVLVGSPRTVRDRLAEIQKDLGIGVFVGGGRIGDMSHEKATRSAELLAREVMPHFRPRQRRPARRARAARSRK